MMMQGINYQAINDINLPFNTYLYKRRTYYIPVYPRAFLQEIISMDEQRRTVTIKFVLFITICVKVDSDQLRDYLTNHLILQFGYNQTVFIPEDITLENSPFLITKMPSKDRNYSTFRVKGKIECHAEFDLMFFPYRQIEISNHLCINSQQFRYHEEGKEPIEYSIKYNCLKLDPQDPKEFQYRAEFNDISFGSFKVDNDSFQIETDTDPQTLKRKQKTEALINSKNFYQQIVLLAHKKPQEMELNSEIAHSDELTHKKDNQKEQLQKYKEYLQPYKHIVFRFDMNSLHLAFVLQQEVPVFMLSIVTLFLFHAQPNIGNKFSCIILLLVSYISVISSFRMNNTAQQTLTIFQWKLMILTLVPILLIITTRIDYYNMNFFNGRPNQIQNPFAYCSLIIVLICFAYTMVMLIFIWTKQTFFSGKRQDVKQSLMQWGSMKDLEWYNLDLKYKIIDLIRKDNNCIEFFDEDIRKTFSSMGLQSVHNVRTISVMNKAEQ